MALKSELAGLEKQFPQFASDDSPTQRVGDDRVQGFLFPYTTETCSDDLLRASRDAAADSMGVTRGALRVLLHRGRAKLKEALYEAERLAGSLTGEGLAGSFAV